MVVFISRRHTAAIERLVEESCYPFVTLTLHLQVYAESVGPFTLVFHTHFSVVHHLVHRCHLERSEHIILVGRHKLIGRRHDISLRGNRQIVERELGGRICSLVECIAQLAHTLDAVVLESVGYIAFCKEVRIKISGGLG